MSFQEGIDETTPEYKSNYVGGEICTYIDRYREREEATVPISANDVN